VAIINVAMAEHFWSGSDPIGQRIISAYRPGAQSLEVIGIVGNVKDLALDAQSPPEMYSPYGWWNVMNLVVRSTMEPSALTASVRNTLAGLDTQIPVYDVTNMEALVTHSIARQQLELFLLGLFALIALALAAVGVYGLLAFTMSRRMHEIGVRIALGASRGTVLVEVLWHGMKLVLLGIAAGLVLSLWLTRVMSHLLYQLSPSDPLTFAGVIVAVVMLGGLACVIPAYRATRVDPMLALRAE
jgi:putative ABC transport system permease protein